MSAAIKGPNLVAAASEPLLSAFFPLLSFVGERSFF